MTARKRLPNRRHAETFELTVGGLRYVCTVGRFADGMIGELFFRTTNQTAPQIRARATRQLSSASRFSTARIWKKFVKRFLAIAPADRRVRSALRWIGFARIKCRADPRYFGSRT